MTDIVENDADQYNAVLAVHQALHQKPTEFADTINKMLADRLQSAVETKREEVAKSIFNGEEPEVQVDDTAPEEDTEEATVEPEVDDEDNQPEE